MSTDGLGCDLVAWEDGYLIGGGGGGEDLVAHQCGGDLVTGGGGGECLVADGCGGDLVNIDVPGDYLACCVDQEVQIW